MKKEEKNRTDQEQIKAYLNGDEWALDELFDSYNDALKRYCRIKVKNTAIAMDISQKVWLKFVKYIKRENFELQKETCRNLLITIARNACIDHFRGHKYQDELDDQFFVEPEEDKYDRLVLKLPITDAVFLEFLTGAVQYIRIEGLTGLSRQQKTNVVGESFKLLNVDEKNTLKVFMLLAYEHDGIPSHEEVANGLEEHYNDQITANAVGSRMYRIRKKIEKSVLKVLKKEDHE